MCRVMVTCVKDPSLNFSLQLRACTMYYAWHEETSMELSQLISKFKDISSTLVHLVMIAWYQHLDSLLLHALHATSRKDL